ncbi:MAG TPA: 2-dehydropantoate 2-reductase [Leptospiraceae bacterium]|nr:2-dehydropantoate 2-reductase [Leptospiraceae bacterium]HMW04159.1 2-dehydropantoate 2-reductase [Leptospiraceae bacterium]HMY30152.1 2-dehydropantoate 2-reductase [Leptospiraceae bacterium]HMZ67223.1 2-dehydropantoate 2-reductase [Leptospiraceae bacterium]HNA06599.1 2-dehydropantoate 2-reductase [Leptospiraceae bacterium]
MGEIKNIAVIGAGAVGCFYGGKLQKALYQVQFQSNYLFKAKTKKLLVKSVWGNFDLPLEIFPDTENMKIADLILITAKSCDPKNDCLHYSKLIRNILGPKTIILVLQNGINMEERLQKVFPKNPILGGLAFTCINRISANEIHHIDYGQIKIGPVHKKYEEEAKLITQIFNDSGIDTLLEKNLRKARYEKLLWNVPFNSLSVLGNKASTKEIIDFEPLCSLSKNLMLEVISIAKSEKIVLKKSLADEMIRRTKIMKPYKTSMLLDYEKGNKMEVESILGEVYQNGKKNKINTPNIEYTYNLMQFLNRNQK